MKNFKTHLEEAAGKGLTIFDIDETMFITKAKVHVVKNGKIVKKLDNQEFNTYKKKPGEEYDYGEFKNAEVFQKTSTPIARMINKVRAILKNATKAGSKVIIVTARPNFDNKKTFLDTFRNQLTKIIPKLDLYLYSLYEISTDIYLFIVNLVK